VLTSYSYLQANAQEKARQKGVRQKQKKLLRIMLGLEENPHKSGKKKTKARV
jgi:hypothetical protein